MELVVYVPLQVEWQVQRRDQFILKLPWFFADDLGDIGILCHPGRQRLLAFDEGHAIA